MVPTLPSLDGYPGDSGVHHANICFPGIYLTEKTNINGYSNNTIIIGDGKLSVTE
jgi:hypothetical protein